jgi:hypothetical protein
MQAATAAECVKSSNITLAMLADPAAAEAVRPPHPHQHHRKRAADGTVGPLHLRSDTAASTSQPTCADVGPQVVFGAGGVLEGMEAGKSYVDMSTVDAQTSTKIAEVRRCGSARCLLERRRRCTAHLTPTAAHLTLPATPIQAVLGKGGRFLEAPVSGSKKPAIDGASPAVSPRNTNTKETHGHRQHIGGTTNSLCSLGLAIRVVSLMPMPGRSCMRHVTTCARPR